MGDYERSTTVHVPAEVLFGYLSDVQHLPAYLPRLTSVTPLGDDIVEVTAHIDPPDGPDGDDRSRLTVCLHTERADGASIDTSLDETLAGIRRAAEDSARG